MESQSGPITLMDPMHGLPNTAAILTKKNSPKKLALRQLKALLLTPTVTRRCLKITSITPSQSRDGLETCIQHLPRKVSTTISTSSRAISSPTIKETILGMRLSSTTHTRRTGTRRLKPPPEIHTTIQEAAFLEGKNTHLLPKKENTITFTNNRAISNHITREITHGTRLSSTKATRRSGTLRPRLQLVTPTTSQEQAPSVMKHMVLLLKRRSMIIFTNSRATSSHTCKETILGMKPNSTTVTRKNGTLRPKHLREIHITSQVPAFSEEKLMAQWFKLEMLLLNMFQTLTGWEAKSQILLHTITSMSSRATLNHTFNEIIHGTLPSMTILMRRTGTRRPKPLPEILTTSQVPAFLEEKLTVLWSKPILNTLHKDKRSMTTNGNPTQSSCLTR